MKKNLIVFYSWSGNTRYLASLIAKHIDADMLDLQTVEPYPTDYRTCVTQVNNEVRNNFRPRLKNLPPNIDGYDTIIIGSPVWWHTMAPPIATFIDAFDFSGKIILPFYTHGGSGGGTYEQDVRRMCKQAEVTAALGTYDRGDRTYENQLQQWLEKAGL